MIPFKILGKVANSSSTVICPYFVSFLRYRSKITIFFHSPLHSTATLEYCHNVLYGKTSMVCLSDGKKSFTICLAISTEYQPDMTDGRTDILPQHSPRYAYVSHGYKQYTVPAILSKTFGRSSQPYKHEHEKMLVKHKHRLAYWTLNLMTHLEPQGLNS